MANDSSIQRGKRPTVNLYRIAACREGERQMEISTPHHGVKIAATTLGDRLVIDIYLPDGTVELRISDKFTPDVTRRNTVLVATEQ